MVISSHGIPRGGDIYYKGYTYKALPVDVKVTYTLTARR